MHPAWFSGPKSDEQIKYLAKEWLICLGIFIVFSLVIVLTQDFANDCLNKFIEWTCSFDGTLDVKALLDK